MRTSQRRGISLAYAMFALVAVSAFCSLAVDLGRVQLAKSELQQANDAAARYAVMGIADGTAAAKAIAAAKDNKADTISVVVLAADVQTGNWNAALSPQFSSARFPTDAVQVKASRSAAKQNAIPLLFSALIGANSCDVHTVSIAKANPIPYGFIGLNGFTVKNNLLSASYDSSVDTSPTSSAYLNSGMIGSNTSITAKNNEVVGIVLMGPGATNNLSLSTPAKTLANPIPAPVLDFSAAPASNPGGVSKSLTVNGTTTLAGGVYYFTSITMKNNSTLKFSGPATLYIDGDVTFAQSGAITAYNSVPANLQINQRGVGSVFGGSNANNVDVTACIDAPQTALSVFNGSSFKGRGTFLTINVKNNAEFYYDQTLKTGIPGSVASITTVK